MYCDAQGPYRVFFIVVQFNVILFLSTYATVTEFDTQKCTVNRFVGLTLMTVTMDEDTSKGRKQTVAKTLARFLCEVRLMGL